MTNEMTRFANGWVVLGMVASGKWDPRKAAHRSLMHWFLS